MYHTLKRLGDIIVALIVLFVVFVPFILIVLALKFSAEGEVFYRQSRIGRFGKPFGILKFATMLKDSPNMTTGHITVRRDPRVTPIGHYLRITKLNEFPQILNILGGTMSWVGPRPLVPRALAAYTDTGRESILTATPGITGIGSLAFRDEEGILERIGGDPSVVYQTIIAPHKEALELWYINHRSLVVDFKLVVLTALAVVVPASAKPEDWFEGLPPKPVALQV